MRRIAIDLEASSIEGKISPERSPRDHPPMGPVQD
jgi:hypothetical protein